MDRNGHPEGTVFWMRTTEAPLAPAPGCSR